MATPRKKQISLVDTKYYHCISRCVRRAYLCGKDPLSGKSYEHRRQWIETKLTQLATIFCIEICAFAVMNNHLHIVMHVNPNKSHAMSDKEVVCKWHQLFKGTELTRKFLLNENLTAVEQEKLNQTIKRYRERLFSISWFMRVLNEDIARRANQEDDCTGRFWEGRFKSQALLDEVSLAACMAYVDLNPIRANMAATLEESDYTSIKMRIEADKYQNEQSTCLLCFADEKTDITAVDVAVIPFDFASYVGLLEVTKQSIQSNRPQKSLHTEPLLSDFDIAPENWLALTTKFMRIFHGAVGKEESLQRFCDHLKLQRRTNITKCKKFLV